jgi:hypothetical protein
MIVFSFLCLLDVFDLFFVLQFGSTIFKRAPDRTMNDDQSRLKTESRRPIILTYLPVPRHPPTLIDQIVSVPYLRYVTLSFLRRRDDANDYCSRTVQYSRQLKTRTDK